MGCFSYMCLECREAVVHEKCWVGRVPIEASDDDPNQGWRNDGEF
jgi:hypothetical protein